jgi:hypothetical protein
VEPERYLPCWLQRDAWLYLEPDWVHIFTTYFLTRIAVLINICKQFSYDGPHNVIFSIMLLLPSGESKDCSQTPSTRVLPLGWETNLTTLRIPTLAVASVKVDRTPWRWRQQEPLKIRWTYTRLYGPTSQKTASTDIKLQTHIKCLAYVGSDKADAR